MLRTRLLLVACLLVRAASQDVCTYASSGFLAGAPFHLAVTYLTPGLPDWRIAVPLPPPECAHGYVAGEETLVCDFDVPPSARIAENGGILVHRNGLQQGYATVNVTVFCILPRYGPLPNLQGLLELPVRSSIQFPDRASYQAEPEPDTEIAPNQPASPPIAASSTSLEESSSLTSPATAAVISTTSTTESESVSSTKLIPTTTFKSSIQTTPKLSSADTRHLVKDSKRTVELPLSSEKIVSSSSEEDRPSENERTLRSTAEKLWLLPQEMFDRFMSFLQGNSIRLPRPRT